MIALDTNLLARLLLNDDAAQHGRARALLASAQVFTAPVTVILELVWVLEANDCSVADIGRGLTLLLNLPNFKAAEMPALQSALRDYGQGMDFADALHLALCRADDGLMTFDKAYARKAAKFGASPAVLLA